MAYTRLHWVESETPLSADNMNNIEDGIEELQAQKVDKVSGKALSDNNYTSEEKTKLAGIEEGATKTPDIKMQDSQGDLVSVTDDVLEIKFNSPMTVTKEQTAVPGRTTTTERIGVSLATTTLAGLMSATDKTKLNGIDSGATRNTAVATTSANGLMAAEDKAKLDGIEAEATKNTISKESVSLGSSKTIRARSSTSLYFTGNFPSLCAMAGIEFTNSSGVAVKDIAVCGFHIGVSGSQTIATVEVYNLSTSDIILHATYTRVRLICFS